MVGPVLLGYMPTEIGLHPPNNWSDAINHGQKCYNSVPNKFKTVNCKSSLLLAIAGGCSSASF